MRFGRAKLQGQYTYYTSEHLSSMRCRPTIEGRIWCILALKDDISFWWQQL